MVQGDCSVHLICRSHHLVAPPLSLTSVWSEVSDLQTPKLFLQSFYKPSFIPFFLWIPPKNNLSYKIKQINPMTYP